MSEIAIVLHTLIYHSNHKVIKKIIVDSDLIQSLFKNISLCEKSFIKSFLPPVRLFLFVRTGALKMLIKIESEITVLRAISIFYSGSTGKVSAIIKILKWLFQKRGVLVYGGNPGKRL